MDKQTLSNYGWIAVCVMVLSVLLALATPFGDFVATSVQNTSTGLYETNQSALESTGLIDIVTHHTAEEIEADDHLYAIGKTKPEYVVAKFNDDYSEVVITKNGNDSDGWMSEFSWSNQPPTRKHSATLKTAIIKRGVLNVGGHPSGIGLLSDCVNLEKLVLPSGLKETQSHSIRSCTTLSNITIPGTVDVIGSGTFWGCTNLKNVNISDGVKIIKDSVFTDCDLLTEVRIPSSVTTIGYSTFQNCNNLKTIYLSKSIKDLYWHYDSYSKTFFDIADNAIIYCETQEVANLLEKGVHYNGTTQVIVDASKF